MGSEPPARGWGKAPESITLDFQFYRRPAKISGADQAEIGAGAEASPLRRVDRITCALTFSHRSRAI